MKIADEIIYPAPPDVVSAMTFAPEFQERKCRNTGARSWTVAVSFDGDGAGESGTGAVTVTTTRNMPTDELPDFVRPMVGAQLKINEVDRWRPAEADGARNGTVTVQVEGVPVRFTGSLHLEPTTGGTRATVDGELKADVPFLGARIEAAAAPAITAALQAEQRTALDWLA